MSIDLTTNNLNVSPPRNVYETTAQDDWSGVDADIVVTDPPFGISFSGKASNYNRDESRVVDGYVEWERERYAERISETVDVAATNLRESGQLLMFSGWNNSNVIHSVLDDHPEFTLQGKMYWAYNFAPYCSRRPAHNVYEIFWATTDDNWTFDNECGCDHCQEGEANLSMMEIPRDYHKNIPKYPTRLPVEVVETLLEHFTKPGDVVFDPLAGSGMVGIVAEMIDRQYVLGDLNTNGKRVYEELRSHYGL